MNLLPGDLLHVYNRGNNKQQVFFNENHYHYFLNKINKHIASVSDILAYCLMPNHFHLLVHVNEKSGIEKKIGSLVSNELQNGFRILQSSYASAINKEYGRTGSIFQQNTKFKLLSSQCNHSYEGTYAEVCFHYIHQNPLKAGLVTRLEDWSFSSFKEYLQHSNREFQNNFNHSICNIDLAARLLKIRADTFYKISYNAIKPELLDKIF